MLDLLFVTAQAPTAQVVIRTCEAAGLTCLVASDFEQLLSVIEEQEIKIIFIDIEDEGLKGLQLLEWVQTKFLFATIGIVARKGYSASYLQALRLGVTERLSYAQASRDEFLLPYLSQLVARIDLFRSLTLYETPTSAGPPLGWVGGTPRVRWLLERALVLGQTFQPVLLQGEAGVGKKHLASIMSRQKSAASVFVLDAACVPDYEQKEKLLDWLAQGAMAGKNKKTFLGTLIIAQITQLHPEIQEALAEYLKDNVLSLQGKNFELTLQLIATSSHSLSQAVKDGFMREDLYNILSHAQWHIPSLSERVEDLPLLVAYHLRQGPHQEVRHYFSRDAMTALCQHEWDHNVAELFASVDAIVQQASQTMVSAHMLPNRILQRSFYRTQAQSANVFEQTYNEAKEKIVADFTRAYFHDLLAKVDGNLTVAAEQAGMDRSNLKKLIKRYGLL